MFGKDGPSLLELTRQALSSTRRGYDLLAPKFDATPFRTPDEILEPALAGLGTVDAALDLCCGTGAGLRLLQPLCRRRLVGVDFSPGMLEQARRRFAVVPGKPRPEWVEADVLTLDYREEFDLVTCFGALGHILPEDHLPFLRMIHRSLRPGGRFVFVTGPPPPLLSVRGVVLRTFNAVMRVRNALLRPPFIMYYLMCFRFLRGRLLICHPYTKEFDKQQDVWIAARRASQRAQPVKLKRSAHLMRPS